MNLKQSPRDETHSVACLKFDKPRLVNLSDFWRFEMLSLILCHHFTFVIKDEAFWTVSHSNPPIPTCKKQHRNTVDRSVKYVYMYVCNLSQSWPCLYLLILFWPCFLKSAWWLFFVFFFFWLAFLSIEFGLARGDGDWQCFDAARSTASGPLWLFCPCHSVLFVNYCLYLFHLQCHTVFVKSVASVTVHGLTVQNR